MKGLVFTILFFFSAIIATAQAKDKYDRIVDSFTKAGQKEKIIPYFQNELKKNPKSETVLRKLGRLYIENNQLDQGEKYYLLALQVAPKCSNCYVNLSRIYATKNDYQKAMQFINKGINADSTNANAWWVRGWYRQEMKKDRMGTADDYSKAIELDPKNLSYLFSRADFYAGEGLAEAALADYDQAIQLEPGNYETYLKERSITTNKKCRTGRLLILKPQQRQTAATSTYST